MNDNKDRRGRTGSNTESKRPIITKSPSTLQNKKKSAISIGRQKYLNVFKNPLTKLKEDIFGVVLFYTFLDYYVCSKAMQTTKFEGQPIGKYLIEFLYFKKEEKSINISFHDAQEMMHLRTAQNNK